MNLVVIPCCKEDASRTEALLDLMYQLEGRKASGYGLIAFAPEVHTEMRDKIMISAQMAFESVEAFHVQKLITIDATKPASIYAMFKAVAEHIAHGYKAPWLWLEPDCIPLKPKWREALSDAYNVQPRRYLSRWLKADESVWINRVGVYPVNITADMEIANLAQTPFEVSVVSKSTKCDLFQQLTITSLEDVSKIRSDAVLLHHDKQGVLMDWVREKAAPKPLSINMIEESIRQSKEKTWHASESNGGIYSEQNVETKPRRGRPPKVKLEAVSV